MQFDPAKYRHHLDAWDLTEDQKLEVMGWVWTAMGSFVDRAFGESAEQILLGTNDRSAACRGAGAVDSRNSATTHFEQAAQGAAIEESI